MRRSRRQKWIDQAQSLNLYIAGASGKKLDITYRMAWLRGLKTTYYLRALGATSTEKSTVDRGKLNAVDASGASPARPSTGRKAGQHQVLPAPAGPPAGPPAGQEHDITAVRPADVPLACSIDDPDCEACQ